MTGEAELRAALRLHPERPSVARLSRRALVAAAALAAMAVLGALVWALDDGRQAEPQQELYSTERRTTAEGLATLPRDYAGVPQLGPPLPGDLGRPILRAQEQGRPVTPPTGPGVDPLQQRIAQEQEAARTSKLFIGRGQPRNTESAHSGIADGSTTPGSIEDPLASASGQGNELDARGAAADRTTVSPDRLRNSPSPYLLQAGSVIAAALVTGLRSDRPGQVIARVTENAFDSASGRHLLVPQGSLLVGTYDSRIGFGQDSVLQVWTRLILPNGKSIVLERLPSMDTEGHAGLEDEVDHHWGRLFAAAALSSILGVGTGLDAGSDESGILQALRRAGGDTLDDVGQEVVRRNLDIPPTITVRQGFPVRVMVSRDLLLEPYRE
ncbi:type IV secretory pathway VirB10-like protein [Inquilinus ginsengisoli]|uniref:TrbI/VirB10 family protein n=1 Tax=Inquilinus ginsengisoli TaxID=363840 RepID=UPI003D231B49